MADMSAKVKKIEYRSSLRQKRLVFDMNQMKNHLLGIIKE